MYSPGSYLEQKLAQLFCWYGTVVGRKPLLFLILPMLLTVAMLPGLMYFQMDFRIVRLFITRNAEALVEASETVFFNEMEAHIPFPSRLAEPARLKKSACGHSGSLKKCSVETTNREQSAAVQGTGLCSLSMYQVYITLEDESNILTVPSLNLINRLAVEFRHNFSFEYQEKTYRYIRDFCSVCNEECQDLNVWIPRAEAIIFENQKDPNIKIKYPVMNIYNKRLDVGRFIYGVETEGIEREMKSAKVVLLNFEFWQSLTGGPIAEIFREKFHDFWREKSVQTDLKIVSTTLEDFNKETVEIVTVVMPFIAITTTILVAVVTLSNISRNPRKSKPFEAFFGIISVLLSLGTTFGLLFYLGTFKFNPICSAAPFLALCIGVDDAFLILGSWRMTNPRLSPERRLGLAMGEAGVSITITTLTDGLCFGIGAFIAATDAVTNFCFLTATAVLVDYLYQITFFLAIVAYGGRREEKGNSLLNCSCIGQKEKEIEAAESEKCRELTVSGKNLDQEILPLFTGNGVLMDKLLAKHYAPMIYKTGARWVTLFLYIMYLFLSLYGCTKIRPNMNLEKFVLDYSQLNKFFKIVEKYTWTDNISPEIVIGAPPDFRDPTNLHRFLKLVHTLETTKYSSGPDSTVLWLKDYLTFLSNFFEVQLSRDFYNKTYFGEFFLQETTQRYRGMVKFNYTPDTDDQAQLRAFKFTTSFYQLDTLPKRVELLKMWRQLCKEYSDLNVTIFDQLVVNHFGDQQSQMAPSVMQTTGWAVIAMTLISAVFIPHTVSIFYVTISLLSMSAGVVGGLALWDCDLDHVSLACILMAIGFSVDFSAHLCYRYHKSLAQLPKDKIIDTLGHVGWPIIQAALSTLLGVSTLSIPPAYLIRIFFKTNLLVMISGLLHALLFLPVMQASFDFSCLPRDRVNRIRKET